MTNQLWHEADSYGYKSVSAAKAHARDFHPSLRMRGRSGGKPALHPIPPHMADEYPAHSPSSPSTHLRQVAHYLVLTHVKENAQAMPMLDLTGVRGRRPTEWGAAPEVAQGAARGRPQRRRGCVCASCWRSVLRGGPPSPRCARVSSWDLWAQGI